MSSEKIQHHAELLSNRVKKRYQHFRKRFARQGIECFRLYDWDIPEVRAVVDWYAGHIVIGEYVRDQTGPQWLPAMAKAVGEVLGVQPQHVHVKQRRTGSSDDQARYQRFSKSDERLHVRERDLSFLVNLDDFLDTGLFSDHRDTRQLLRTFIQGKDFLNCFAYTGAFTCAAAAGLAKSTVTVDRSKTYLKWAQDNLALNKLDGRQHTFVQSDVEDYLKEVHAAQKTFDVIFIDPPSFFKDQVLNRSFDVNKDHIRLIRRALKVLRPQGEILFSTNHQRFEPRLEEITELSARELTPKTIPEDYRNQTIHRCWRLTQV